MILKTIPYHNYEKGLPQTGNFILGQQINGNIIVYQAFNDAIADYAVKNQKFGGPAYSFSRMTWIKPNFLWMMYRSGWAEKENQTRILAVEIASDGFQELLTEGVLTSYDPSQGEEMKWRDKLNSSDVRIQWDPDHNHLGDKLQRRAVQIGIKNEALLRFNNEYIRSISDITNFVKKQKSRIDKKEESFDVIDECIIDVNDELKAKFEIPATFISPFVQQLIADFKASGAIAMADFQKLLIDSNERREEFINYIKNYQDVEFSRYLLKTAISCRKGELGECACLCEDLLVFSYFVSKNKSPYDFDLIMEAKLADFDTWSGFDGEMIFYTLGFEKTKEYLKENVAKFSKDKVDYFLDFSHEYLYNDISRRAFWYF